MIDLIFLVSLREMVRQRRAEDRELAANAVRFVPVIETVEAPPITPVPPVEVERECVRHKDMIRIPNFRWFEWRYTRSSMAPIRDSHTLTHGLSPLIGRFSAVPSTMRKSRRLIGSPP